MLLREAKLLQQSFSELHHRKKKKKKRGQCEKKIIIWSYFFLFLRLPRSQRYSSCLGSIEVLCSADDNSNDPFPKMEIELSDAEAFPPQSTSTSIARTFHGNFAASPSTVSTSSNSALTRRIRRPSPREANQRRKEKKKKKFSLFEKNVLFSRVLLCFCFSFSLLCSRTYFDRVELRRQRRIEESQVNHIRQLAQYNFLIFALNYKPKSKSINLAQKILVRVRVGVYLGREARCFGCK